MPLSAARPAGCRQAFPLSIRADGLIHSPGHGSCNSNDEFLRGMGIDSERTLQELHVRIEDPKKPFRSGGIERNIRRSKHLRAIIQVKVPQA